MNKLKILLVISSVILLTLAVGGCKYIISGTFVFVEKVYFTAETGFYFYQIDVTDEEDWQENKDKIDFADAVGLELYVRSLEDTDVYFDAYVDDYSGLGPLPSVVPASATQILDSLLIPPGETVITYKESLKYIIGFDRLKALALTGRFDYYGLSTGSPDETFYIDSAYVIITLSGSD